MNETAPKMTAPPEVYRTRRSRLAASSDRPMVILAGRAVARNYPTNTHLFRAGSSYLYFGGPAVEGAAWLIEPGSDGDDGCTLLRPPPKPDDGVWIGDAMSDSAMAEAAGIRAASVVSSEAMASLLAGRTAGSVCPPSPQTLEWVRSLELEPATEDELRAIVEIRLIKDEHELAAMRRAGLVAVEAHQAAMRATRPGHCESEAAAALRAVMVTHHCVPSFTPILSVHGEVLHATGHHNMMNDGDLLLCDAGAEEPGGYASDVSRTWPVSGTFSPVQRHLYDTVRRAHEEGVAACVPGRRYRDVHDLAERILCEGLAEAELLRGEVDTLFERHAQSLFFPHGIGHLIGLDVHDMEDFGHLAGYPRGRERRLQFGRKYLRLDRDLQPGMAVTIEPGLYLVPAIWARDDLVGPLKDLVNRPAVDALLAEAFGGIRIEDTICVREGGGPEKFTGALPTDADAVAAMVGGGA